MTVFNPKQLDEHLKNFTFHENGAEASTRTGQAAVAGINYAVYVNEFWTSGQRRGASLHEISYRACFKPQLPRFFIDVMTEKGDRVYDPYSGRGTTVIEAALCARTPVSNDVNPLSRLIVEPRLDPPTPDRIEERLAQIPLDKNKKADIDLSMFYHPETEAEIVSIREYILQKEQSGRLDSLDRWVRMVAANRLTGHSKGFFSVYTLPPNQAVTQERQILINQKRDQTPDYRDTRQLILKKTRSLLRNLTKEQLNNLAAVRHSARFHTADAGRTQDIPGESIQLVVTSPPFLKVVQYDTDNWLRCWFNGLKADEIAPRITMTHSLKQWARQMESTFVEFHRILSPKGYICFEVGEVQNGKTRLEDTIIPIGCKTGFHCLGALINQQNFTKTSNIWGVANNKKGTNTNRIAIFQKP